MWTPTRSDPLQPPASRRLRGYAFDPSLSSRLDTAVVNATVFHVPWEPPGSRERDGLSPGPVGEYLEVVDYDPASGCFYEPVDLNSPLVLAQDGLAPSEGNPQFHQQMVYAVAMTTIRNFERALGRKALWAPNVPRSDADRAASDEAGAPPDDSAPEANAPLGEFVRRLRIYPHALREANAYYSPEKKALLFGYFPASPADPGEHIPGGIVFTCLSHDIIAHETTHALLDGMHRRFIEPTHPDTLAFHEALSDIVALFQHFTFPEVLRHQIARTRGDLAGHQSLLGELAQEFGRAIGNYGALRSAIGSMNDATGRWEPQTPRAGEYRDISEPHARGAILVAAVFDAFLAIYRRRAADLIRIATSGTGVLPAGDLHPDLVNRLAGEAAKTAQHVLTMCIRALDYSPPVDLCFGDYLRALITADADLVPDDDLGYRIAFIEAFRRRGIYPSDVRTMSVESLRWRGVREEEDTEDQKMIAAKLRTLLQEMHNDARTRQEIYEHTREIRRELHKFIRHGLEDPRGFEELTGLVLKRPPPSGITLDHEGRAKFEVHAVRPLQRVGPDGDALNQVIISITQKRIVGIEHDVPGEGERRITFRGGVTLILDLLTLRPRYAIRKRIDSAERLEGQRRFMRDGLGGSLRATYLADYLDRGGDEPFALLHRPL